MSPWQWRISPAFCSVRVRAAAVDRRTPSISARNSCLSARVSPLLRSWITSNERAHFSSSVWTLWQAMLWRTWPRNAWHRLADRTEASGSLVGHLELGGFHGQGRAGHLHQVTTERAIVAQKGADPDQASRPTMADTALVPFSKTATSATTPASDEVGAGQRLADVEKNFPAQQSHGLEMRPEIAQVSGRQGC